MNGTFRHSYYILGIHSNENQILIIQMGAFMLVSLSDSPLAFLNFSIKIIDNAGLEYRNNKWSFIPTI